jgi:hypothetical protein
MYVPVQQEGQKVFQGMGIYTPEGGLENCLRFTMNQYTKKCRTTQSNSTIV